MLVLMLLHTLTVLLQTSSMILQLLQVGKTSLGIYFELDELIDRLRKNVGGREKLCYRLPIFCQTLVKFMIL